MKKGIILLVCMLMIVSTIIPVSGSILTEKTSHPLSKGNILYVGGSGPGNYSRIQDAINDSSDGDTVFVFDDSSPYVEHIVVDKSITLKGEEKNSTVILGANTTYGVNITVDAVSVLGFTIQNFSYGVYLMSSSNWVSDNIFRENSFGLLMYNKNLSDSVPFSLGYNVLRKNLFIYNSKGIYVWGGWNNTIEGNMVSQNYNGITVGSAVNTVISMNHLSENLIGVGVYGSYNTTVSYNNFTTSNLSILTMETSADNIRQNNFINNNWSAMSSQRLLSKIRTLKLYLGVPLRRNVWDGNYWDEPRSLPFIIPGVIMIAIFKVPFGFQVDWHPAQKPYDIPGMS